MMVGSLTDKEYEELVATYGPGLSLNDMRRKKWAGNLATSMNDLEKTYYPGNDTRSLSEEKFIAYQTYGSVSDSLTDNIDDYYQSGAPAPAISIAQLFAQSTFTVGHRGSGDVWPEHSQVAYQGAYDMGAQALEMSIQIGAEGTWFHLHDVGATGLNRTTNRTGDPALLTNAQIDATTLVETQLGKFWIDNPPALPKWTDMMTLFFNKVVIFLESKDYSGSAVDNMLATLEANYPRYKESVIFKSHVGNTAGMNKAKAQGMKVWCYVDTIANLAVASQYDYIGVPGSDTVGGGMSDADIASYVATGKPVLTWSPSKRQARNKYFGLGIKGIVSSREPYTRTNVPNRTTDQFATNKWAAGDIPYDNTRTFKLTDGTAALNQTASNPSVCMGSISPAGNLFTIDFDMQFTLLPTTLTLQAGVAFSKDIDDRYQFQSATMESGGYHFIQRADGNMQLYRHVANSATSTSIAGPVAAAACVAGQWMHYQIEVTLTQVIVKRTDGAGWILTATDNTHRGTYFHLSRGYSIVGVDGAGTVRFKNIVVVQK
jgi:glycerophosphoryl diester phosphodiesterase